MQAQPGWPAFSNIFHWAAIKKTANANEKRQIKIIAEAESGSMKLVLVAAI